MIKVISIYISGIILALVSLTFCNSLFIENSFKKTMQMNNKYLENLIIYDQYTYKRGIITSNLKAVINIDKSIKNILDKYASTNNQKLPTLPFTATTSKLNISTKINHHPLLQYTTARSDIYLNKTYLFSFDHNFNYNEVISKTFWKPSTEALLLKDFDGIQITNTNNFTNQTINQDISISPIDFIFGLSISPISIKSQTQIFTNGVKNYGMLNLDKIDYTMNIPGNNINFLTINKTNIQGQRDNIEDIINSSVKLTIGKIKSDKLLQGLEIIDSDIQLILTNLHETAFNKILSLSDQSNPTNINNNSISNTESKNIDQKQLLDFINKTLQYGPGIEYQTNINVQKAPLGLLKGKINLKISFQTEPCSIESLDDIKNNFKGKFIFYITSSKEFYDYIEKFAANIPPLNNLLSQVKNSSDIVQINFIADYANKTISLNDQPMTFEEFGTFLKASGIQFPEINQRK